MKKQNYNRGFTLLFASLVGALVIAVGMAILSITLKQIALSSAGKATQQAFYTADAATECAVFLNRGGNSIDTNGEQDCLLGFFPEPNLDFTGYRRCNVDGTLPNDIADNMICMGKKIVLSSIDTSHLADRHEVTSTFVFDATLTDSDDAVTDTDMCFTVEVKKISNDPGTTEVDETETIIQTRGYNTCRNVPNRFERAIRSVTKSL